MRFNRVLLVTPGHTQHGAEYPPVGLGYLSEALSVRGIEHDILDMRLGSDVDALEQKIRQFKPDLIGMSMVTLLYQKSYDLLEQIRRLFPDIAIAAGGPHISIFKKDALEQCPAIDFGFTLEGERSLVELCEGVEYGGIKGCLYREASGHITYTGARDFITSLDSVPFPRYTRFALDQYDTDEIALVTSRGCPYECIFCAAKSVIGRVFRFRTAQSVVDEIQHWHEKGRRNFCIVDDNLTLKRERVLDLCQEIEKRKLEDLTLRCPNGIRADRCDQELLRRMRDVGFTYVAFGVECGNDRMLKRIKKGERLETIKQSIQTACDLGYDVALFFVVGAPEETWEDIEDSVALARSYPIFDAKFFNLIPFPGTELFDWVHKNGYFIEPPEDYLNDPCHWNNDARWDQRPVFATPEFPLEQRREALVYISTVQKQIKESALRRKLKVDD